jgi:hypothetical protein
MPANDESLARLNRFVSVIVLLCVVTAGGMWFYLNRAEIMDGRGSGKGDGSTWFTRWAGIDHTKLKPQPTGFDFGEQESPFKTKFEFDPDWIQNMNTKVQFDWDR